MDELTEEKWKIKVNPTVVAMRMYDVYPITIARMNKWFFVMRALNPIVHDVMNRHSIVGFDRALYYAYSKAIWRHTFKYPEFLWDSIVSVIREHFIKLYKADPKILDELWRIQKHIMRFLIHKLKSNRPTSIEPYVPRKPWEIHPKVDETWRENVLTAVKELDTTSINRKDKIDEITKKDSESEVLHEVINEVRRYLEAKERRRRRKDMDINDLPEEILQNKDVMEALESVDYYFGGNEGVVIDPKISKIVEETNAEKELEEALEKGMDKVIEKSSEINTKVKDNERKKGRSNNSSKAMGKA